MKLAILSLLVAFNLSAFAADVNLEPGLYVPANDYHCAYEVVSNTGSTVEFIFRNNPLVDTDKTCPVGVDYVIKGEILDSKTFIDVRNGTKFSWLKY